MRQQRLRIQFSSDLRVTFGEERRFPGRSGEQLQSRTLSTAPIEMTGTMPTTTAKTSNFARRFTRQTNQRTRNQRTINATLSVTEGIGDRTIGQGNRTESLIAHSTDQRQSPIGKIEQIRNLFHTKLKWTASNPIELRLRLPRDIGTRSPGEEIKIDTDGEEKEQQPDQSQRRTTCAFTLNGNHHSPFTRDTRRVLLVFTEPCPSLSSNESSSDSLLRVNEPFYFNNWQRRRRRRRTTNKENFHTKNKTRRKGLCLSLSLNFHC